MVPLTACNQWKCSCLAQAGGGPQRIKSPFLQHCLVTCMKSLGVFGHFKFGKGPKHNSIQQSPVLSVCLFALLNRNQDCHHGCHPIAFISVLTGEVKDCLRHEKWVTSLDAISLKYSYRILGGWDETSITTNDVPVLYINCGLHVPVPQKSTFEDSLF